MRVRELNNAERDAWRQKGLDKAELLIEDLDKKGLDVLDRFDALDMMVSKADYMALHCSEHFNEAGEYVSKDGLHTHDLCQKDIDDLAATVIKAEALGKRLTEEMGKSSLSRVNGTSRIFQKWAARFGVDMEGTSASPAQNSAIVIPRELAYK